MLDYYEVIDVENFITAYSDEGGNLSFSIEDGCNFHDNYRESLGGVIDWDYRKIEEYLTENIPLPDDLGWEVNLYDEHYCIELYGLKISDTDEIDKAFDSVWGYLANVLNRIDPGSFGSPYMFGDETLLLECE